MIDFILKLFACIYIFTAGFIFNEFNRMNVRTGERIFTLVFSLMWIFVLMFIYVPMWVSTFIKRR